MIITHPNVGPTNPYFGMTPTKDLSIARSIILNCQCHTIRRLGRALPANPSIGMTIRKILESACFAARTSCLNMSNPYLRIRLQNVSVLEQCEA